LPSLRSFWHDATNESRTQAAKFPEAKMAGFCRNCGSPLDDTQVFCAKCGIPVSGSPVRQPASAVPPGAPPAPRPPSAASSQPRPATSPLAPQAVAAAPSKSGNTLVKVLLIFLVVIFVFGAIGAAGMWYVVHRVKQKVHEIGLDDLNSEANSPRTSALAGIDPCSLLAKADVAQAATMDVVRAEPTAGNEPGCQYSVEGDYGALVAKHASLLNKQATTDAQRQQFESMTKNMFKSMNSERGGPGSRHPGESPVFLFSVSNSGALAQMNLSRMAFGRLNGTVTVPGVGDDAMDIGGAMMLVRKGNNLIRIMYMMCPCATDDVVPLARKLVASL
jgi:cell division protein FtsB